MSAHLRAAEAPIGPVLQQIGSNMSTLLRQEGELLCAKMEDGVIHSIKKWERRVVAKAVLIAEGMACVLIGTVFLSLGLWHLAAVAGLPQWACYLLIGAVLCGGGVAAIFLKGGDSAKAESKDEKGDPTCLETPR